ncbi:hypothetical protein CSC62_05500 [Pseudoxanthomonas jiangsuensis]|uniref:hypothetical protein n=1 Tax=Pseudoxanthomonas jiangsuensis TaxID=619688 RepID=UPI001391D0F9|nr:hypothetical protein [Pseudoxanthomonas jiangsuensis]KAF1698363.1 hypothetical protein CSC62_05500 [Pseudoxanthomonas jiangsuensis]
MATFRILDQAPQYLLPDGRVNAGGSLSFYETNLSTPKLTWSDPGMATPNPYTVALDAAGRTATDVWGDGAYGVVMKDAAGVTIWTRNNVRAAGAATQEIPALVVGQFLTNDGSNLLWQELLQLPDPSGSGGYYLSTDGVNVQWVPPPAPPEATVEITSTRMVLTGEDGSKWQVIRGTATTSSGVGTLQAQGTVTYPNAFSETVWPVVTPTGGPFAPGNAYGPYYGDLSITAANSTGFTFIVNTNHADPGSASQEQISGNITVSFFAMGPIS